MESTSCNPHAVRILTRFLFLIAFAVTSKAQDNFYFDPAPSSTEIVEGKEAILHCDVSNRAHIQFYWELNNRKLKNTSRRYQDGSDLRILQVHRTEDAGSFRCIATNVSTGVSFRSTEAKIDVLWIDKTAEVQLKQPKTKDEIKEGVDIILKCHINGNPDPKIDWFKNKISLIETEAVKFRRNNRLHIQNIGAADNGVYSCKASNKADKVESVENFLLNIRGSQAAYLNELTFTRRLLVHKGGEARFNCEYQGAIIIEWYLGERRLSNDTSPRITVFENGTLLIKSVQRKDQGRYSCVGISESGPVQTFVSELVLASLEPFRSDSFRPMFPRNKPVVVPEGKNYQVDCIAPKGLPPPSTRWTDPKGDTVTEAEGRVKVEGTKLVVTGAQPRDSGNYSCVATNMAGEQKGSVWIMVSVPPVINRRPRETVVEEGATAVFDCGVNGSPYPVTMITWLKDGQPVEKDGIRVVIDHVHGKLTIKNVKVEDGGDYACSVNTTGHSVVTSSSAALKVLVKLKFLSKPVNRVLELGSNVPVHCLVEGEEPIKISWLKIGQNGLPNHVRQEPDGSLRFHGVRNSDEALYRCEASNNRDKINATIRVTVVVRPKFKIKPVNTTAEENQPVLLHCSAYGDPHPVITWDKEKVPNGFDLERFKVLSNGSLYIKQVYIEDTGRYGCTAGNTGGLEREEIYLFVARPDSNDSFGMMKTIIIAVCCAVAYLGVVIGLTVYCSIRLVRAKNMRKARQAACAEKAENGDIPHEQQELMDKKERDSSFLLKSDDTRSHISGISSQPSHSSHSHSGQSSVSGRLPYDKYNFPRHVVQNLGILGKGSFGEVFLGRVHGLRDGEADTLVVVKSLQSRDENHHFEFRRELDMFGKVNCDHVVKLLGLCREVEPQLLITEYCEWGDLKQFLWAMKKDNGRLQNVKVPPLTTAQKLTICSQVALAMEHLSNHRFVHKDLAARNVLLAPNLDVKVTSLSLCRDVYAGEYFMFHQQLIPLRWMPAEAVLEDDYSTKSDVWSYAVFCSEVFTLGEVPYRTRTNEEVLKGLKMGDLELDMPPNCPPEMVTLIGKCMADSPKDRPSFSEISIMMGEIQVDSDV